jgi:hypothetical protein
MGVKVNIMSEKENLINEYIEENCPELVQLCRHAGVKLKTRYRIPGELVVLLGSSPSTIKRLATNQVFRNVRYGQKTWWVYAEDLEIYLKLEIAKMQEQAVRLHELAEAENDDEEELEAAG